MAVVIDGTTGIATPGEAVSGNLSYTGTLTGGTGVVNLGSGQVYKDASGNVGIGTTPANKIDAYTATGGNVIRSQVWNADTAKFRAQNSASSIDLGQDGSGGFIEQLGANPIRIFTNNIERARIDSSGKLCINTTSPIAADGAFLNVNMGGSGLAFAFASGGTGQLGRFYANNTSNVGNISVTASATSYNTSSDYRLKEAIAPMTGALAKVALLKPCTYKWKVDGSDGQGFIAHELDEVVPGCVTGEKDAVDSEGAPQYQGIDTSFLVATLTAAIQEQQALIAAQAISITALNERLTALEAPIV